MYKFLERFVGRFVYGLYSLYTFLYFSRWNATRVCMYYPAPRKQTSATRICSATSNDTDACLWGAARGCGGSHVAFIEPPATPAQQQHALEVTLKRILNSTTWCLRLPTIVIGTIVTARDTKAPFRAMVTGHVLHKVTQNLNPVHCSFFVWVPGKCH